MATTARRLAFPPPLPSGLEIALKEIGNTLASGKSFAGELDTALGLMADLCAAHVVRADSAIANAANLGQWRLLPSRWGLVVNVPTRQSDMEHLVRTPKLENLFIFHRDGRLREAALLKLSGGLPSPFMFAAVVWRLNDWAQPVRDAAVRCARRCFPVTDPDVIARVAAVLLVRQLTWGRWNQEREILDEAFGRPDVAARLSALLIRRSTGPMSRVLRSALRMPPMDHHLERIAREAVQPSVRAAALNTLINAKAEWPNGHAWEWVDKSMGLRRRIPVFAHRDLAIKPPRPALIALGVNDRSAAVRRVALDGVMRHLPGTPEGRDFAARLAADCSPSVRERAHFILRRT